MTAATADLVARLPAVRGSYRRRAELARTTWFRVGGAADVLFRPADEDDLAHFMANRPVDVPVTAIGVGSNLLVRDGGVPGVVVRLGRGFSAISARENTVRAGAGALDVHVAQAAAGAEIAGLEFLSGVPGTIGGALRMNAGAYGRDMKDAAVAARAVDPRGECHELTPRALGHAYRSSAVPEGWIFTSVLLRGRAGDKADIAERMASIARARRDSQPTRCRTGGSTFKNPAGHKAWELIERAGCRGLRRGHAMVSEQHCNFLINNGSATATELEELGCEVRRKVRETAGIALEWEIRRVGLRSPRSAAR